MIKVSNSEIDVHAQCRRRWWLTYYRGLTPREEKATGALALGTRIHTALEGYYAAQLDGEHDADLLAIHSGLIEADRVQMLMAGHDTGQLDNEADLGQIMLSGYLDWIAQEGIDAGMELVGVEDRLEHEIIEGEAVLTGKVDLRLRNKRDGTQRVVDFKPQPMSEPVMTPSGFVSMGDLKVGDYVMGRNYLPTMVTGVYDKGEHPVWKITFKDKTTVRATSDHPWLVQPFYGKPQRVVTTLDLLNRDTARVVSIIPEDSPPADLPIHPYVLGQWIGDGTRASAAHSGAMIVTCPDISMVDHMEKLCPGSRHKTYDGLHKVSLPIKEALAHYGLADKYSYERFIPIEYLTANKEQRWWLLRGLMDADGQVSTNGFATSYATTSEQLANDVGLLVRSLGGYADPGNKYQGKRRDSEGNIKKYRLFQLVNVRISECPFFLGHKAAMWEDKAAISKAGMVALGGPGRGRGGYAQSVFNPDRMLRRVISVEFDGYEDCRCIQVAASDSLYLTTGLVVTHNTSAQLGALLETAAQSPQLQTYCALSTALDDSEKISLNSGTLRILKKVKRTAKAQPPFYVEHEVRYSREQLRNHWRHTRDKVRRIVEDRNRLDAGEDHHDVVPPHVTKDCTWICDFKNICPMFDDGSAAEAALDADFTTHDPRGYLESDPVLDRL